MGYSSLGSRLVEFEDKRVMFRSEMGAAASGVSIPPITVCMATAMARATTNVMSLIAARETERSNRYRKRQQSEQRGTRGKAQR